MGEAHEKPLGHAPVADVGRRAIGCYKVNTTDFGVESAPWEDRPSLPRLVKVGVAA